MDGFDGTVETFVAGTLRGYRVWLSRDNDDDPVALRSMSTAAWWGPGRVTATCLKEDWDGNVISVHPSQAAPAEDCSCGLYGVHDPWDWQITTATGVECDCHVCEHAGVAVSGVIEAWGRVIVGERGFRAQHAQPLALAVLADGDIRRSLARDQRTRADTVRERLAYTYQIPVFELYEDLVRQYPPTWAGALRPQWRTTRYKRRNL